MFSRKSVVLVVALFLVIISIVYLEMTKNKGVSRSLSGAVLPLMERAAKSQLYQPAKEITTPDGFINTDEISVGEQVGKKVVLLDFWTYSCINCQRTTPYLNAWYEKYKDQGLVIIGVHTPEFEFEKKYGNVKAAVEKFGIKFPVVLDNDYSTWQAYNNHYWPRKYLIDIDGYIIYDHIGEGGYAETEKKIQEALKERLTLVGSGEEINRDIAQIENDGDAAEPRSPEVYFGSARNTLLKSGFPNVTGRQKMVEEKQANLNDLQLAGQWYIETEYATNEEKGAKIIFPYQATKVYLVAGADKEVELTVLKDGQFVKKVLVSNYNLYPLIDDSYGQHKLEIIIDQPGLQAYTFTFG